LSDLIHAADDVMVEGPEVIPAWGSGRTVNFLPHSHHLRIPSGLTTPRAVPPVAIVGLTCPWWLA